MPALGCVDGIAIDTTVAWGNDGIGGACDIVEARVLGNDGGTSALCCTNGSTGGGGGKGGNDGTGKS